MATSGIHWMVMLPLPNEPCFLNGAGVDPLVFEDYPPARRERLGDRLPTFATEESAALRGSFDCGVVG